MYPASFPGLGKGLDFLLILFFYQEKAAAAAGEVYRIHNGESHVPGQLPRPRQRPRSSFASFLALRQEKKTI